jgi:hypothetical protein
LVVAFSHATSGTSEAFSHATSETSETPVQTPVVQQDIAGQRLLFAFNDYVQPQNLDALRNELTPELAQKQYFSSQPIVFLNGCETGTGGVKATTDESFPGILVGLGARGVIVTEAPVWLNFGYEFGKEVMTEMFQGGELATIILSARRKFIRQNNNPLGLIYSYYGNPAAGFHRAVAAAKSE